MANRQRVNLSRQIKKFIDKRRGTLVPLFFAHDFVFVGLQALPNDVISNTNAGKYEE